MEEWELRVTNELLSWIKALDVRSKAQVVDAIDRMAEAGPGLGRPLVDRLEGSHIHNLKELRPGSAGDTEIRIVFVFDPWRSAILLVGGDKSGDWSGWYRRAISHAERVRTRSADPARDSAMPTGSRKTNRREPMVAVLRVAIHGLNDIRPCEINYGSRMSGADVPSGPSGVS